MASTRNNNTMSDYKLQQYQFDRLRDYTITPDNDTIIKVKYPEFGVNYQSAPVVQLSSNSTDLESELFGIGSTNLVKPKQPVVKEINTISKVKFVDRLKPIVTDFPVLDSERPQFK